MTKRTLNILGTIFLLITALIIATQFFSKQMQSKWVLVNGVGAKCLDVEDGKIVKGAPLIGHSCHGKFNQQFNITFMDGPIQVGELCLDLASGSKKDGTQVILWPCHGGSTQHWLYDSQLHRLMNRNSKCLDLAGGAKSWNSTQPVVLWSCNQYTNQQWYLSKKMPPSDVVGGTKITPGTLMEIRSAKNIFAKADGSLIDRLKIEKKENQTKAPLALDPSVTVIDVDSQKVLVPANAVLKDTQTNHLR